MNFTKRGIERLLDKHERLLEIADDYVAAKYPNTRRGDIKFEYGGIYEYVNGSCHCHPEYEWQERGSVDDLYDWMKTKDYTSKYYTVKG
jgi:hypothetical protein